MSLGAYATQRQKVIKYILEFCKDEGLDMTFEALSAECAEELDGDVMYKIKVPSFGLHSAVDMYESFLEAEKTRDVRTEMSRFDSLVAATAPPPQAVSEDINVASIGAHTGNVLAMCSVPSHPSLVVTSSASRDLVVTDVATQLVVARLDAVLDAVAICIDVHSVDSTLTVLAGLMNGSVVIATMPLDGTVLTLTQCLRVHSKYVIGVKWCADKFGFATASHDQHVGLFKPVLGDLTSFELAGKLEFKGQVESLAALCKDDVSSNSSAHMKNIIDKNIADSELPGHRYRTGVNDLVEFTAVAERAFVVGVRGDHLIHILDLDTCSETDNINLNTIGDDHVSFVPLSLEASPRGNLLLVCTDMHRIILFDVYTKQQIRNYYGGRNDGMSNPIVRWGGNSGMEYVYCTTQDNEVYAWNAHTQKVDKILCGHVRAIKGMTLLDDKTHTLATTGFDKTIKVWK